VREDTAEGQLMIRLIDTPEFQRLRRIKQLGLGLYTYQGAEHSRFTHSLGAMHLMTRILKQLEDRHSIDQEERATVRAAALLHDVGEAIRHPGGGRLAIATGAPGFLVISLDALRQIEMRHETHVGLVDTHAERDRRDDHDAVLVDEAILMAGAQISVKAGVIGQRPYAGPGQRGCGVFNLGT